MCKLYFPVLLFLLLSHRPKAEKNPYWQEPTVAQADSLKQILLSTENDTIRMYANRQLGLFFQEINRPIALSYYEAQLKLATKLKQSIWEAEALSRIGYVSSLQSNYSGSLKSLLQAKEIASDPQSEERLLNVKPKSCNSNQIKGVKLAMTSH